MLIIPREDWEKISISRSTVIFTANETAKVICAVFLFLLLLVPFAADATVGQILPSRHAITRLFCSLIGAIVVF